MLVMLDVGNVGYMLGRYGWVCWVSVLLVMLVVGTVGYVGGFAIYVMLGV